MVTELEKELIQIGQRITDITPKGYKEVMYLFREK